MRNTPAIVEVDLGVAAQLVANVCLLRLALALVIDTGI
jgi:hypothetical protein